MTPHAAARFAVLCFAEARARGLAAPIEFLVADDNEEVPCLRQSYMEAPALTKGCIEEAMRELALAIPANARFLRALRLPQQCPAALAKKGIFRYATWKGAQLARTSTSTGLMSSMPLRRTWPVN